MVHLPPETAWRSLRKICNSHIFASQRLDASQGFRSRKVSEIVSFLEKSAGAEAPVDVGRAAFTTTLNIISTTVFSEDMVKHEESSAEFKVLIRDVMVETGGLNVSDYFPLLRRLDPQGRRRRFTIHLQKMKDIFDRKIDERLRSRLSPAEASSKPADFLDVLLDEELDRPTIIALLVDLFVAGSDTSSTTVEWAMAELFLNPTAMGKAREEVADAMEGLRKEAVEESDVGRMPYLQAVVKETLRLHPPAPLLIPRRAAETVQVAMENASHYTIPAGTRILVNAWAIGRDPSAWGSDADVFRPERFTGGELRDVDYRGRHMELIPFGAGRRICPGLPLASRMVHLILANLLWSYAWPKGTTPADISMAENFRTTVDKAEPLLAVPVLPRKRIG